MISYGLWGRKQHRPLECSKTGRWSTVQALQAVLSV
jgi:hypothetical protein